MITKDGFQTDGHIDEACKYLDPEVWGLYAGSHKQSAAFRGLFNMMNECRKRWRYVIDDKNKVSYWEQYVYHADGRDEVVKRGIF